MSDIYIIGAAGHGREVAAVVRDAGREGLIGFLDDSNGLQGRTINGLQVLGDLDSLPGPRSTIAAALGVGYPEVKARIVERLQERVGSWPSIVHPSALIGDHVEMAQGVLVQAGVVITANVTIDEFVTLNVAATVSHDCILGAYSTISPGAHIGGNVEVGEGAFIGIGASVIQDVRIGAWSVIGAGAAVISDVPANSVVAGVPGRVVRTHPVGWHGG